jgi:hypothetical protein
MLLINMDREANPPSAPMEDWIAYSAAMRAAGVFVAGEPLEGRDAATTLRIRNGKRIVTDGQFAETKELLAGFYILEVPDLDAALDWAARMPDVELAVLELRPIAAM